MGQGALVNRSGDGRLSFLCHLVLAALVGVAAAGCGETALPERPCAAICNGITPICDPAARRCVGCLGDDDCAMGQICVDTLCKAGCSAGRPDCPAGKMCDLKLSICRGCRADAECSDPALSRCEVAKERCVPCLAANDNCKAGTRCAPKGDTWECTNMCKVKADCQVGGASADCCGGLCIDTASSAQHCGGCGRACSGGGKACCTGTCIDTSADVKNCGGCGQGCALPHATAGCAAGACTVSACEAGFGNCNMGAMDGCEVDLAVEVAHCGACGAACPMVNGGTASCTMGACGIAMCNAGLADCDKMSGNGCEVDTGSDLKNCGACGQACPAPANMVSTCAAGKCAVGGCKMGFEDCDQMMMNGCEAAIGGDINNCGMCGKACSIPNASPLCLAGACVIGACNGQMKDCNSNLLDGCEINAGIDSNNCGSCSNSCANTPHATAACANGVCGIGKCDAGWGDCDKQANNGCETSVVADALNCGACGMKCPAPANVFTSCNNSVCMMGGCVQGYFDCNNNLNDGCEAKLADDPKNCSKCGMACPVIANGVAGCSSGICGIASCNGGFADCNKNLGDGCEANLTSDNVNCGMCGNVCGNMNCNGGMCGPPRTIPNFNGELGPDYTGLGWTQCLGILDKVNIDDLPNTGWGMPCIGPNFNKLRLVCGANANSVQWIEISRNVLATKLNAYPEKGLISAASWGNLASNDIYAENNDPNTKSWWVNGNGCNEASQSITVNNICTYDVANCFGQNLPGDRYFYVYVKQ